MTSNANRASERSDILSTVVNLAKSAALCASDEIPLEIALRVSGMETPSQAKELDVAAIQAAAHSSIGNTWLFPVRQVAALLRKNEFLPGAPSQQDLEAQCFAKFRETQKLGRIASKRLNHYFRHPSRMPPLIAELLGHAQLDLFHLLGPEPGIKDWRRFDKGKLFSAGVIQGLSSIQGASLGLTRDVKDTNPVGKMDPASQLTSTRECLSFFGPRLLRGAFGEYVCATLDRCTLVDSAQATSVPKDALTRRFITISALINSMAQHGIRAMWEPYLEAWGITLDDQRANSRLAQRASLLGLHPAGWSTVDLTSASDFVLTPLVRYLIPTGWERVCDAARESQVTLEGELFTGFASYSTMGNGFTFPLECLIFAALTRAAISLTHCEERRYQVYGDDIIVPTAASLLLLEALRFCGFIPNLSKTHVTGFFRESCGGDYLLGDSVSPVKLTGDITLRTTQHVLFNLLQRRSPSHPVLDFLLELHKNPFVGLAVDRESVADGYFEAPCDVVAARQSAWYSSAIQAVKYRFSALVPRSIRVERTAGTVYYLACLSGSYGRMHDVRGTVKYRLRTLTISVHYRLARYSLAWYADIPR